MVYNLLKEASLNTQGHLEMTIIHMKNDAKSLEKIAAAVKQDMNEKIDQWIREFAKETGDLSSFPSISQLETDIINLDNETRKIFLKMLSDCLSNIEEKEMISSKKAHSD